MSEHQFNNPDELLQYVLDKHDVPRDIYDALLGQEKSRVHLQRRKSVTKALRHIIEQNANGDDTE
jgi:hypothetical protein